MLILGIQDGDLGEFAYNFNFVTSNYYKDVDRKELLQKAFTTIIDELNDPYTEMLDQSFKDSMENGDISCENVISNNTIKNNNNTTNNSNNTIKYQKNVTTNMYYKNDKKIAYIKLQSFSFNSASHFKTNFVKLSKYNFDSLIIDLRDNLGGENTNLVNIASIFLDSSKIICKDQFKNRIKTYYSKGEKTADYPIVILGNINSASCSEILICALREGCGAKLIGTRTYGKNVAQIYKETPNYFYKFTAAYWLTPSGKTIDKAGIKPDIEVFNTGNDDEQLNTAIEYLANK